MPILLIALLAWVGFAILPTESDYDYFHATHFYHPTSRYSHCLYYGNYYHERQWRATPAAPFFVAFILIFALLLLIKGGLF